MIIHTPLLYGGEKLSDRRSNSINRLNTKNEAKKSQLLSWLFFIKNMGLQIYSLDYRINIGAYTLIRRRLCPFHWLLLRAISRRLGVFTGALSFHTRRIISRVSIHLFFTPRGRWILTLRL